MLTLKEALAQPVAKLSEIIVRMRHGDDQGCRFSEFGMSDDNAPSDHCGEVSYASLGYATDPHFMADLLCDLDAIPVGMCRVLSQRTHEPPGRPDAQYVTSIYGGMGSALFGKFGIEETFRTATREEGIARAWIAVFWDEKSKYLEDFKKSA